MFNSLIFIEEYSILLFLFQKIHFFLLIFSFVYFFVSSFILILECSHLLLFCRMFNSLVLIPEYKFFLLTIFLFIFSFVIWFLFQNVYSSSSYCVMYTSVDSILEYLVLSFLLYSFTLYFFCSYIIFIFSLRVRESSVQWFLFWNLLILLSSLLNVQFPSSCYIIFNIFVFIPL